MAEEGEPIVVQAEGEGSVVPVEGKGSVISVEENTGKNTTLIESLKEQPSFLMQQYNEQVKKEAKPGVPKGPKRSGGVYVPPHKLRELQQEMMDADPSSEAHQKLMW